MTDEHPVRFGVPHVRKCRPDGMRYVPVRTLFSLESCQEKVLLRAEGDSGLWFACSLWHFATHFAPCDPPAALADPPPEKAAGHTPEDRRSGQ